MSDRDSKLLNLYLDGELPDEHRKEILDEHQEEYSQLLKLRSELRGHFQKKLDLNFSKESSEILWDKIETEIKKPVVKKRPWYSIPMQGYALAAMCSFFAFFIGAQLYNKPEVNLPANSNFKYVSQGSANQGGVNQNGVNQRRVHQIAIYNQQDKNVFHRLPIELDTEQLIGFNDREQSVAMRTNGLDIDWMESDKNYKLVKSSVPVIWVSE